MGVPKIAVVASAGHFECRPLKTGQTFTLVIARPVLNQLSWDKACYQGGEVAGLHLDGHGLREPLALELEQEDAPGCWVRLGTVTAQPDAGGDSATAQWQIPLEGPSAGPAGLHPGPGADVTALRFLDAPDLGGQDTAWLEARVQGLEGEQIQFLLERDDRGDGDFTEVGEATALVHDGQAKAGIELPAA